MQENKNEKVDEYERAPGMRPRLALYHANARGTGCAIKMELHPASGAADGGIFCTFATQKTVGYRLGQSPTFPTFDWTEAHTVKLAFDDLAKMQQVFRGECESINGDNGIWHFTARGARESACATSLTRFQVTRLSFSSVRRAEGTSVGGCSISSPRRRWASAR